MSTQLQKATGAKKRGAAARLPDSEVRAAGPDQQVVQMAQAESAARALQRQKMIADAAYYRAERRSFEPGHELDDWLAAEAEIADVQVLASSVPQSGNA